LRNARLREDVPGKTVEARSTRGSIPARGSFCERRLLLGRDPLGLLREPEPFAHKLVKAGP
jgi:hypothetical protein